jgi:TonB-linked SusC/RagA family outer membrane protein
MRKLILLTALVFIVSLGFSKSQIKSKQQGHVQFSELIKKIEKKFDVSITYETEIAYNISNKQVSDVIEKETVEEALSEMLKTKNITFTKIRDDYYVLVKKIVSGNETTLFNSNQINEMRTITGTVSDNEGNTLPGVIVVAKENKNIYAMTDLDGKFSITVDDKIKTLVFTYIGFLQKEVKIEGQDNISVTLEKDLFDIDEIIVSGVAGNTLSKKLTVTVEKIEEDQIKDVPASSSASILQGKIPGVMIKSAFGTPGSGATVKMRGATSINGSDAPLILLDGIMVETNLADINVDDIESVEVVKGAAASALYGSKAANGVIVVNTKRGSSLKETFQIKVRNEYGISNLQKTLDLSTHHNYQLAADNDQFPYTKYEGVDYDENGEVITGSPIPTDSSYADQPYAVVRDLQKEFFKTGKFYTNFISLANKTEKSNFYLSYENNKNTGIIFSTEGYSRQNFRFNADTKINKFITVSTSNLFMNAHSDLAAGSTFEAVLFLSPDINLFEENSDGTPYRVNPSNKFSNYQNPLYPLYHLEMYSDRNSFMSNVSTKINLTEWFNIDAKYTIEKLNQKSYTYNKKGYLYGSYVDGQLYKSNGLTNNQNYQITGNFDKMLNEFTLKSKISYLFEEKNWDNTYVTGKNFVFNNSYQLDFTDQTLTSSSSNEGIIRAQNIFGIVDADYKGKYLFSGLIRRDGSSLFGENERWHTYYRIAGAYRLTEDISIPGIQELKLRAAIGTSGLRPGYDDQYEIISVSNGIPYRDQLGNKDLKPSKSQEIEYALNMQFLSIFNLNASYSETTTTDAILSVPLASHAQGFAYQTRNAGTIFSNALEIALNIKAINKKDMSLSFGFNYDRIRQKVLELEMNKYYTGPEGGFLIEPGQNYGVIIGKKWLTSLDEMANQLPEGQTIEDYTINSDGYVISAGTEGSKSESPIALDTDNNGTFDKVVIADCNTDFNMNVNTNFSYKGFSVYMLWGFKKGGDVYNRTKQYLYFENRAPEIDQYGKPENEKKSTEYYQKLYNADQINSHFVEDGSFIKLRELSVAYKYDFNKQSKIYKVMKSFKVGLIGRNLLNISNYSGYDAEVGTTNSANFSYDSYGYPNFRTFTGSVEFTF